MQKIVLLFSYLFLFSTISFAQSVIIIGKVVDADQHSLPGAGVVLLSFNDSSILSSSSTDTVGNFRLVSPGAGNYILKVSFLSFTDYVQVIKVENESVFAGKITLYKKSTSLKEVNVNERVSPVQSKGDTMQYNADAFKVNKDATAEDLATKMPGVTVQDGKVQAQGEDIKKILIDGKPFLGDDPNAALKNFPAEFIDKIQVFDRKSDQSAFTGFDDGNTTKTMNIVTRPQFRNGTFGKVYSGYGTDELWKDGMNINFFKDKRKLTFLGNANNVNEQNFSSDDLLGVIGTSTGNRQGGSGSRGNWGNRPGSGHGRYGPNEASNFLVDQKNGIATTYAAGLNYTNQWKKFGLTISYFFNHTKIKSTSEIFRQYFTGSDVLNYKETGFAQSQNMNHRANLALDYKFDSLNSILLQPKITLQKNDGNNFLTGVNNGIDKELSNVITDYNTDVHGYNLSFPLLYRHSFLKKGRTLSLNTNPVFNENTGENNLLSESQNILDTIPADSLDQLSLSDSHGWNNNAEITYTEPITEKAQLSLTYKNYYSITNSDKRTLNYSQIESGYTIPDSSLSNTFENKYFSHSAGINYRAQNEKMNFMAGFSLQEANLKNIQEFPVSAQVDKKFISILPSAMFQYKFNQKKNLRIFLRSSNNNPSINQLQDVINNSNPLQLTKGNPGLKQDWQNGIFIRYSNVNNEKNTSLFLFLNTNYTLDYIGNSATIALDDTINANGIVLTPGSQLSYPVNLDGYYFVRSFANFSFPLKKLKSNFNVNGNASFTRTPSLINEEKNYSSTITGGIGFSLSSNISDKYDFTLSSFANMNNVKNTIRENLNSDYFNLVSRIRFQIMPWKGIVLASDLTHTYNSGLTSDYNSEYVLWNASAGYKFLKNRVAEIRLTCYDLLEKNTSVTRNTTDTYYEDVRYNQIQRFFMLTFTYNLKFFKSGS